MPPKAARRHSTHRDADEILGTFPEPAGLRIDSWISRDPSILVGAAHLWQERAASAKGFEARGFVTEVRDVAIELTHDLEPKLHPPMLRSEAEARAIFTESARLWREQTAFEPSVIRAVTHPSYLRIIGLGLQAVPLILDELEREVDPWFAALIAIVGEDIGAGHETPEGARQAWLEWGATRGYRP